jgi:Methyltransferase domain
MRRKREEEPTRDRRGRTRRMVCGRARRVDWEHRVRGPAQPRRIPPTGPLAARGIPNDPIIDVDAGASPLVDCLLGRGFQNITGLDIANTALAHIRARLGRAAERISVIRADVTQFPFARKFALWHDRAVFHFLTDPVARRAYVAALTAALRPRAHAIIATFALDGPQRCSGLDVARYDPAGLASQLGGGFHLIHVEQEQHVTPANKVQHFQYCSFRAAT